MQHENEMAKKHALDTRRRPGASLACGTGTISKGFPMVCGFGSVLEAQACRSKGE